MDMLSSEAPSRTVDSFDARILVDMLHADILKISLVDKERVDQFQSVFDRAQIGTWYLHQIDDNTIASRVYLRSGNYERRRTRASHTSTGLLDFSDRRSGTRSTFSRLMGIYAEVMPIRAKGSSGLTLCCIKP